MKYFKFIIIMPLLASCGALPQLYQAAEDIADDTAFKVEISKEAIQKQTDVSVSVELKNNPAAAK